MAFARKDSQRDETAGRGPVTMGLKWLGASAGNRRDCVRRYRDPGSVLGPAILPFQSVKMTPVLRSLEDGQ